MNHNGVDRDMTADEIAEHEKTMTEAAQDAAARAQVVADRAAAVASARAKLAALGLTEDEVAAIIGGL